MSWTCKQVTGQPHCLIVYLGQVTGQSPKQGCHYQAQGDREPAMLQAAPEYEAEVSFCFLLAICNDHYQSLEMKMTHLHQVSSVFNHCILIYSLLLLTWLWRPSIRLKKYRAKQYYSCIFDQSAATCETVLLQTHVGTSLVQKSQPTTAGDSQMDRKVSHVTQESGIKS